MEEIQKELEDWAKEAYAFYYPKAKELDMDFYTQSSLRSISEDEPVHLMVIGINPGFGGRFQPNRFKESSDILDGNVVDGNPVKIQGFRILKTLRSILEYSGNGGLLDDEKTFVFTNATFFSTHKESGLAKRNDRKEINLKTHFQWEHIYISLCKYCKDNLNLEVSEEKEDWKRFSIKDSGGNDWLILALINQEGNKGIGIRYQKKNQPKDDDFEMILSRLQRIDAGFKPNISKEKVIWIGWLNLLNLQCKDADGCIEGSKRLLDEIIRALSEHI